jgi:DNA-binding transcriptional LysR family regulator
VSVPPGAAAFLAEACLAYMRAHPLVEIELSASSRHVDLVGEGFDLALRAGMVYDEALVARRLFPTGVGAVASPAYVARRGLPTSPEELVSHACLLGTGADDLPRRRWPLRDGGEVAVAGRIASNDLSLLQAGAVAGDGIALLPSMSTDEDVAAGRLVRVLPDVVGAEAWISIVYVERAFLPAKVRTFVDHLAGRAARCEVHRGRAPRATPVEPVGGPTRG